MLKQFTIASVIATTFAFTACTTVSTPEKPSVTSTTNTLTDKAWILTHIAGEAITTKPTDRNIPSLLLDGAKSSFSGADGCNRIMGTYTHTETSLKFGNAASTMMACMDENIQKTSQSYNQALSQVASYQVTNNTLILKDQTGNTVLQFTSAVQPR